jgi:hypothetical protein
MKGEHIRHGSTRRGQSACKLLWQVASTIEYSNFKMLNNRSFFSGRMQKLTILKPINRDNVVL